MGYNLKKGEDKDQSPPYIGSSDVLQQVKHRITMLTVQNFIPTVNFMHLIDHWNNLDCYSQAKAQIFVGRQ